LTLVLIIFICLVIATIAYRQGYISKTGVSRGRRDEHREAIHYDFTTLDEVQRELERAGLESSQLIIGIDYTKSNKYNGRHTFGGKCLHSIDPNGKVLNPYQLVVRAIGRTLEHFDDDHVIPTFGFGDSRTTNKEVFPFGGVHGKRAPVGVYEVLARYNEITPKLTLSGPTNFAPLIKAAVRIVRDSKAFHILLIIADGQVTDERKTIRAIVGASKYPLSIVMVGVGDGPWDMMKDFDDKIPSRAFDNFQFVNFHDIMNDVSKGEEQKAEAQFAIEALGEIPSQFKAIRKLDLL